MQSQYGQPQPYGTYPQTPPKPSRPIGVSILAILIGLVGFLFIVAGALLAAFGILVHISFPLFGLTLGATAVGIITLIFGLITLGLAVGLWHQRMWALVLAIIVFLLNFVSDAVAGQWLSLGAIISIILVIYLIAVHRHFL